MSKQKKTKIAVSHQLHAFVNKIITKCALEKTYYMGIFEIPYNVVMEPKPDMHDVMITVEINAYWDGDLDEKRKSNEPDSDYTDKN